MAGRTSIVALLPSAESVRPCLDCAMAAADGLDAEIAAIHVSFNEKLAWVAPEELALQHLRNLQEGNPEVRAARTRAAYDAWVAANHPALIPAWKDDEGHVEALVATDTGGADLVVMRNPQRLDGRDAFHSVLFRSRRLLLVAPPQPLFPPRTIGRHIVVGWKPRPQAERALHDAAAWLRKAAKVSVVCVRPAGKPSYRESAEAALAAFRPGVEPVTVDQDGPSVGRQLLAEAERLGGDCLLIGAFHHGMIWDAVFGGVTRDVLASARLPVFLRS